MVSDRPLTWPLHHRRVALVGLALATVPAITAGLAIEGWALVAGPDSLPLPALAGAMPLVAIPLAALLLALSAADIEARGRRVRELESPAHRVETRL